MKKVTKYSLVAGTTLGLVAMLGVANLSPVNASSKTMKTNRIVDKISERFSLDKSEVAKVFEEERLVRYNEKLSELLADGKITEEQKTLMENHFKEMSVKRTEILNSDKTDSEKETALEELREEGKQFREDNNFTKLGRGNGPKDGKGLGKGNGQGMYR